MSRTTLDIDSPILKEVKALQKKEGRSLGQLVSQLLAEALDMRKQQPSPSSLNWNTRPMEAQVDLMDKDSLYALLDEERE